MVMIPATISRGDVVLCDLNPVIGTEQAGIHSCGCWWFNSGFGGPL